MVISLLRRLLLLILLLHVLQLATTSKANSRQSSGELPACKILQTTTTTTADVTITGEATSSSAASTQQQQQQQQPGRVVVVGDIHGSLQGLHEILVAANIVEIDDVDCTWSRLAENRNTLLVQVGDLVDRGEEALEAMLCLERLYETLPKKGEGENGDDLSAFVRLLGNHEMWWAQGAFHMRNKKADTKEKVLAAVRMMKQQMIRGEMVGAYSIPINGVDLLFVHAGYRDEFLTHLASGELPEARSSAASVAKHFNEILAKVVEQCPGDWVNCPFDDYGELFEAGPERGGKHIGGPLWTDFRVLERDDQLTGPRTNYIQIVGHSAASSCDDGDDSNGYPDFLHCGDLIRATENMQVVCVDGGMVYGMRSFLEVNRTTGVFAAHEVKYTPSDDEAGISTEWVRRELNSPMCV